MFPSKLIECGTPILTVRNRIIAQLKNGVDIEREEWVLAVASLICTIVDENQRLNELWGFLKKTVALLASCDSWQELNRQIGSPLSDQEKLSLIYRCVGFCEDGPVISRPLAPYTLVPMGCLDE